MQIRDTINLLIIAILSFFLIYYYMGAKGLEEDFDKWGKQNNSLNLERDFELYRALKENNTTILKNNLDLNFMFHLSGIEKDSIFSMLDMRHMDRLCQKYNFVKVQLKSEYRGIYPSSIEKLDLLCKEK